MKKIFILILLSLACIFAFEIGQSFAAAGTITVETTAKVP